MVQNNFFPLESRLRAFAQLKQDKINGRSFFVPYQAQPFGFQPVLGGGGNQFCQPFRFVDQKKIAAEFQKGTAAAEKILWCAAEFLAGVGQTAAGGTFGKVGRIGYAAGKASGRKPVRYRPQIGAYAFHTGSKPVPPDILQGFLMGVGIQFHAGNTALSSLAAQQQSQSAAAGTQV